MAHYLLQISYTAEAWASMTQDSQLGLEELRLWIERLAGTLESYWLSFGACGAVIICQLPDHASATALSMAATSSGMIRDIKTIALMSPEESAEAFKKASGSTDHHAGHAPMFGGLPALRSKPAAYKGALSSSLQKFRQRMGKIMTGR